jgi:hypothetical protein
MKLAGVLTGGKMRPASFDPAPSNASAWAAEMPDGKTRLILINKDDKQDLQVVIPSTRDASVWRLKAPALTATAGVTLAGTEMTPKKLWQPSDQARLSSNNGQVQVEIEPGSAVALFFSGRI